MVAVNRVLERADRARQVAWVLWVILGLNWAVALAKILLGLATRSIAVTADGLHSFSDGASNIIGLVAIRIARHPADEDHPYGHQKYETLASTAIAFLLFLVAFRIYSEAFRGIFHPEPTVVGGLSFVVMGATLLVNFFVVAYEKRAAKRLNSDLLKSDSQHTMTDIFVTLSVLASLIGTKLGVPYLDAGFSFVVATVILFTAFDILKKSSDVLCDKVVLDAAEVKRIVTGIRGVRDCHEIRSRGKADDVYLDLHVLVDNEMTVVASHDVANEIEKNLRQAFPVVHDVVVHIEPVSHGH
jgi:cation diffusion facilitator family transporter